MRVLPIEASPGDVRLTLRGIWTTNVVGASAYLAEPGQLEAFKSIVRSISDFGMTQVQLTDGLPR